MIEVSGLPGEPNVVAITEFVAGCGFELAERYDRGLGAYYLFAKPRGAPSKMPRVPSE
jgi:hypothetical protein